MISDITETSDIKKFIIDNKKSDIKIDGSLCNALRRIMISDVPTMSIEIVSITANNGILPDESIAHRLGLIPISITNFNSTKFENIKNHEQLFFIADVEHSGQSSELESVYSSCLKLQNPEKYDFSIEEIINQGIIITKLAPGHKITLSAIATVGTGSIHSKWSPSCGTSFIDNENDSYTFRLETTGSLDQDTLFIRSIAVLKDKLRTLF